ncbi:MAG: urease accessory protein [Yoonia sp.]|jgi:urease accessory protein
MTTEVLTLAQWLSPSYPVGGFAYSHGLETVIADGTVVAGDDLFAWLADVVSHGTGHNDCTLLKAAYGCVDLPAVADVDAHARVFSSSAERLRETALQGAAFCQTTAAIWGKDLPDLTYPVAVGWACRQCDFDVNLAAAMYLQSFASNLVSAAVRAVPLGQTEGQSVLARLSPLCHRTANGSSSDLDDLHSTAFLSDIAAMRHETLQPRIFRS